MIRECLRCKIKFEITPKQSQKVYCDDCAKVHYAELRKKWNAEHSERIKYLKKNYHKKNYKKRPPKIVTCKMCEKEMEIKHQVGRLPKYCTKCCMESGDPYLIKLAMNRTHDY